MAPKKAQKMSLGAFLEDSALGSWADEMEALPTAPAPRTDDGTGFGDRGFERRDGFLSTRPDRASYPPREDVPIPTQPPYNAFVGNLSFDVTESHLEDHFTHPDGIKNTKIIRDHAESSKGFGYVEFNTVEGLKAALSMNGTPFMNRVMRVNVADPPKERMGGFGGGDDKFSGNWRRDGPLPDLPSQNREGGSRRRYEGLSGEARESVSDGNDNWRSNRPARAPEPDLPPARRRGSGFSTPSHEGETSPADAEEKWTIGGKFRPSAPADGQSTGRFGSMRGRGDMGPPPVPGAADETDWRKSRPSRSSTSPTNSVPPTPQMTRRKLELLPRSTSASQQPTPVSSPKSAGFTAASGSSKPNPFGAARPIDSQAREAAVEERLEKERIERSQHSMSRQNSKQPRQRPTADNSASADGNGARSPTSPTEGAAPASPRATSAATAVVRPAFSFANAAAGKSGATAETKASEIQNEGDGPAPDENADVEAVVEKVAEISV